MNFFESLIDSYQTGIKRAVGEYPNKIQSFCIGSVSKFIIHKNISLNKARKIYAEYKDKLMLGRRIKKTEYGDFILEKYHCMEAISGETACFMFPIDEVVEHDPNEVIDEWIEQDKKKKGFMRNLLEEIEKEKEENKSEQTTKTSSKIRAARKV